MTEFYQLRKRMLTIMWSVIGLIVIFEIVLFLQVNELKANSVTKSKRDVVTDETLQHAVEINTVKLDSLIRIINAKNKK